MISIDKEAFRYCESLASIIYCGTNEQWDNIEKGKNAIPNTAIINYHNYTGSVVAPTQTEAGYTVYTCDICGDSYKSDYTSPLNAKVLDVSAQAENDRINITWTALEGAEKYIVYVYDSEGNCVKVAQKTSAKAAFNGIYAGEYTVKVIAKVGTKWLEAANADAVKVTSECEIPTAPTATVTETTDLSIAVEWNEIPNATGYFVRVTGNGKTFYKTTVQNKLTLAGLFPATEYKISVNAKTDCGYSGYSEDITAKTTGQLPTVTLSNESIDNQTVLKWSSENTDTQPDKVWIKKITQDGETQLKVVSKADSVSFENISGDICVIARVKINGVYKYIRSNTITL